MFYFVLGTPLYLTLLYVGYVATQAKKNNISIRKLSNSGFASFQRTVKEIDELQLTLTDLEARLQQMNQSKESLLKKQVELIESKHVLRETANFFSEVILTFI